MPRRSWSGEPEALLPVHPWELPAWCSLTAMSTEGVDADLRPRPRGRWLLLAVALLAVLTALVMLDAGGWAEIFSSVGAVGSSIAFLLWAVAPFAGAGALVAVVPRHLARGRPVLVLGVAALAVLTVLALVSFLTSESSTSALLFLFLPAYQWLLVAVTTGVAALVHAFRDRRARAADLDGA